MRNGEQVWSGVEKRQAWVGRADFTSEKGREVQVQGMLALHMRHSRCASTPTAARKSEKEACWILCQSSRTDSMVRSVNCAARSTWKLLVCLVPLMITLLLLAGNQSTSLSSASFCALGHAQYDYCALPRTDTFSSLCISTTLPAFPTAAAAAAAHTSCSAHTLIHTHTCAGATSSSSTRASTSSAGPSNTPSSVSASGQPSVSSPGSSSTSTAGTRPNAPGSSPIIHSWASTSAVPPAAATAPPAAAPLATSGSFSRRSIPSGTAEMSPGGEDMLICWKRLDESIGVSGRHCACATLLVSGVCFWAAPGVWNTCGVWR
eukprot:scaffold10189_cov16-Tisochrysis_lutea.AAC.1